MMNIITGGISRLSTATDIYINIIRKIFPTRLAKQALLITSLLTLNTTSCAPRPIALSRAPNGPAAFQKGYDDGCNTGLAAFGNSFYKSFYDFTKDFSYEENDLYQNGWDKGYNYCRQYAMKWTHSPLR